MCGLGFLRSEATTGQTRSYSACNTLVHLCTRAFYRHGAPVTPAPAGRQGGQRDGGFPGP
eukprot:COSAG02_NODE_54400_length_296_cov_0.786802_1_plen_59_part_01